MEKVSLHITRNNNDYVCGVGDFIEFVKNNSTNSKRIRFPCRRCQNMETLSFEKVHEHLFFNGIDMTYNNFFCIENNHILLTNMHQTHAPLWMKI